MITTEIPAYLGVSVLLLSVFLGSFLLVVFVLHELSVFLSQRRRTVAILELSDMEEA